MSVDCPHYPHYPPPPPPPLECPRSIPLNRSPHVDVARLLLLPHPHPHPPPTPTPVLRLLHTKSVFLFLRAMYSPGGGSDEGGCPFLIASLWPPHRALFCHCGRLFVRCFVIVLGASTTSAPHRWCVSAHVCARVNMCESVGTPDNTPGMYALSLPPPPSLQGAGRSLGRLAPHVSQSEALQRAFFCCL